MGIYLMYRWLKGHLWHSPPLNPLDVLIKVNPRTVTSFHQCDLVSAYFAQMLVLMLHTPWFSCPLVLIRSPCVRVLTHLCLVWALCLTAWLPRFLARPLIDACSTMHHALFGPNVTPWPKGLPFAPCSSKLVHHGSPSSLAPRTLLCSLYVILVGFR